MHPRNLRPGRLPRYVAVASAALTPITGANTAVAAPVAHVSSKSPITIGFILKPLNNPYFATMDQGARAAAKALGVNLTVAAGTSLTDPTAQTNAAAALITHGYSCYIANPIDPTNLIAPLVRAQAQHVPIINVDLPISQSAARAAGVHIVTYIGTDNTAAGTIAAVTMSQLVPKGSQIAIIAGPLTDPTSIARVIGFRRGAAAKGLRIVDVAAANWDTTTALNDTAALLEKYPALKGLLVANGEMAEGVQRAIQNAHKQGKVDTIGIIGDTTVINDVRTHVMAAAVEQFPYVIGQMGVEACVAAVRGKHLPASVATPVQVVTPANAAKALKEFPRPFAPYKDPFAGLLKP